MNTDLAGYEETLWDMVSTIAEESVLRFPLCPLGAMSLDLPSCPRSRLGGGHMAPGSSGSSGRFR
jgi:hypothetical protein